MPRSLSRAGALFFSAIGIAFAIHDMVGLRDAYPAAPFAHYGFFEHLWGFVRLLALVLAATIVLKAYDRRGAPVLTGALVGLSLNNTWWFYSRDDPLIYVAAACNYAGIGYGVTQFMRFAASYTAGDVRGIRKWISAAAKYFGTIIAVLGTLWWLSVIVEQHPVVWYDRGLWLAWDAANILTIISAVTAVSTAGNSQARNRVALVAWCFCIAAFGTAMNGFSRIFSHDTEWAFAIDTLAQLIFVAGLGYAMLRNRLLDKEFFVQSTAAYGSLTVLLAAGEVLMEKATAHLVPEQAQGGAAAAGFGLSIVTVLWYKNFERWTEQVAKRFSDEDRARLHRFAQQEAPDFRDAAALEDRLLRVLENYGGASGVALYRCLEGDVLQRVSSTIAGMPKALDATDAMLEHALPMRGGGKLNGAVFVEGDRVADPEQRKAMMKAVHAAGSALDALRAAELAHRVRTLEAQLEGARRST
jgi:hypothetical protein